MPSAVSLRPNTESFERDALIAPSGFREYDARWLYPEQLNGRGIIALGAALGTMACAKHGAGAKIVVGHDYRSYSADVKHALVIGLMSAGCHVLDIGLALSPVAYYAQFELDAPCVAMVTASHNENGWTGVKMGINRPMTFGPDEMGTLKSIVMNNTSVLQPGGTYTYVPDIKEKYIADLVKDGPLKRKLKVVVACGNGTAGAYAPHVFRALGCDVVEMDCDLDYTFPKYNPNPEDLVMLHAMAKRVTDTGADIAFGFDGDGDRCGVVDHTGDEIFADKIGVLLARDLSNGKPGSRFVVDVKSTGLYLADPVLQSQGAITQYWKTGNSYIKSQVSQSGALAGFEKSGHFFFNAPLGRSYDDGILSAIMICRMLDRASGKTMADLKNALPVTYLSPTMQPTCPDDMKYPLVDKLTAMITDMKKAGQKILGQDIADVVTVNGVRFTLADGTWGLVRASSNKPVLSIVVESPVSEKLMYDIFGFIDNLLSSNFPEVGEYDQKLKMAS